MKSGIDEFQRNEWLVAIDASSFAIDEWKDASQFLYERLKAENLCASPDEIREYLSCCAQATVGTYPLPSFSDIVEEFYSKFGMDSAKSK